jgi:high-affinity iron transporter
VVLEGVVVGLLLVAAIGWLTFGLQSKLPYKKMLVATGLMLGAVLLVMVGESVQELQQAGWIGTTPVDVAIPGWMGLWLAIFPNVQTIVAQVVAAVLVVGSYFLAEELRVRRPRRRGASGAAEVAQAAEVAERPSAAQAGAAAAAPARVATLERP